MALVAAQAAAGGWKRQNLPARHGILSGVACFSPQACTAVGSQAKGFGGSGQVVAERWDGHRWSVEPTPDPQSTPDSSLVAVSCPSATMCMAVGETDDSSVGRFEPLAERWNGRRWSIQRVPRGNNWYLYGVSCSSALRCTAVGTYLDRARHRDLALAERWNGQRWSIQKTPDAAGAHSNSLQGVSCPSATTCTAVGSRSIGGGNESLPLIERWNGHLWAIQRPAGTDLARTQLLSVSCPAAQACTAVGYGGTADIGGTGPAVAEHWNGHRWSLQRAATGGQFTILHGVSCSSAHSCTAVGQSLRGFDNSAPLAERWNGRRWSVQWAPRRASGLLLAVSCRSAHACTAAGQTGDPRIGQERPLVERSS